MTNQQNLMWPILLVIFGASSSFVDGSMPLESGDKLDVLTDSLIHEFMSKLDANDNLLEDNLLSVNDYSDEDQVRIWHRFEIKSKTFKGKLTYVVNYTNITCIN